jgi:hypothetical protein
MRLLRFHFISFFCILFTVFINRFYNEVLVSLPLFGVFPICFEDIMGDPILNPSPVGPSLIFRTGLSFIIDPPTRVLSRIGLIGVVLYKILWLFI